MNTSAELDTALAAVRAGRELLSGWLGFPRTRPERVNSKAPHDYQTEVDVMVEQRMAEVILSRFPNHGILGEEAVAANPASEHRWYIDPIDGTRNFIEDRPEIAISLALYNGGRPVAGVISLPGRGIDVAAEEEGRAGLIVNGRPFQPRPAARDLSHALVGIQGDIRNRRNSEAVRQVVGALAYSVEGFRITGALAYDLACVAIGEIAARVSLTVKPVDVAAGAILITQAGGVVTDAAGGPWSLESTTILAASSEEVHSSLVRLMSDVRF